MLDMIWLVVLCKRESASSCLPFPLFVLFSFSPVKISVTDFSAPMRARVFKFCIHLERGQVYCGKYNQDAEIHFGLFSRFPFFRLSLSVVHREICVKDFSVTTMPRILKLVQMLGIACCIVDCVRENQPPSIYHSLYLSRAFKFYIQFESHQVYHGNENQDAEINFILLFPFFHLSLNVIHREICVKDFLGTTMSIILKFSTNIGYDMLYCVKENQPPDAYHSLYCICPFFFLFNQIFCYRFLSSCERQSSNFV